MEKTQKYGIARNAELVLFSSTYCFERKKTEIRKDLEGLWWLGHGVSERIDVREYKERVEIAIEELRNAKRREDLVNVVEEIALLQDFYQENLLTEWRNVA